MFLSFIFFFSKKKNEETTTYMLKCVWIVVGAESFYKAITRQTACAAILRNRNECQYYVQSVGMVCKLFFHKISVLSNRIPFIITYGKKISRTPESIKTKCCSWAYKNVD